MERRQVLRRARLTALSKALFSAAAVLKATVVKTSVVALFSHEVGATLGG